jgi:hypothetical protein
VAVLSFLTLPSDIETSECVSRFSVRFCFSLTVVSLGSAVLKPTFRIIKSALTALRDNFAAAHTQTLFLSHLFAVLDCQIANSMLARPALCSALAATRARALCQRLRDWVARRRLPTDVMCAIVGEMNWERETDRATDGRL